MADLLKALQEAALRVAQAEANAADNRCAAQQGPRPSAPHVHEWEPVNEIGGGTALRCSCGSIVSGRVKAQDKWPETCRRCTDCEIELLRERFAEEIAENESLWSQNEALIASRNMLERGMGDLRAELARTKDALAEAVMAKRRR